uniref:Uncharacterized protein n=1 Tax=Tetranychus urticae TaxID=32264 RepID=T1KU70_TETUR
MVSVSIPGKSRKPITSTVHLFEIQVIVETEFRVDTYIL